LSLNIIFYILGVVLEELISVGIVIDYHLLEHLYEMIVDIGVAVFDGL
jgi:hypothetical protein